MDPERSWQRVTDVVRKVAKENGVPMPAVLERVTGDAWQRDAQRRQALKAFAEQVDDFPRITNEATVHQIADELDGYWLENHQPKAETEEG